MDLKKIRNIEIQFKQLRLYIAVFACLCFAVTCIVSFMAYDFAKKQREKVYVLDNGKSLILALQQDAAANRPVEAREHIRRFHELFFTLSPDKKAIENNINRAFQLSDRSAYAYYKDLAETGYYNRIVSGNVLQTISFDSINCNFDRYPYHTVVYAKQTIKRASSITYRNLITSCDLSNSVRSDDNPQGFIITKFKVLNNSDIKTDYLKE